MTMEFEIQDAIVTTNKDPAKANRIKVALQDMDGQEYPEWIEPVLPPSLYGTPEPEDKVKVLIPAGLDIIEFAHLVRYIGVVWDEENPPPADFQQNYPYRRGMQTKAGHTVLFDDKDGSVVIWNGKTGDYHKFLSSGTVERSGTTKINDKTQTHQIDATVKAQVTTPLFNVDAQVSATLNSILVQLGTVLASPNGRQPLVQHTPQLSAWTALDSLLQTQINTYTGPPPPPVVVVADYLALLTAFKAVTAIFLTSTTVATQAS